MPLLTPQAAFLRRISAAQLLALFDHVPEQLVFIKDRARRFVAVNRAFCEYCGVGREREALGKTDHDLFPKARADQYCVDDEAVMRTGETLLNKIECAPAPIGSPRLVSTTKVPLRDGRNRIVGLIGLTRPLEQMRESPQDLARLAPVIEAMHLDPAAAHRSSELARQVGLSPSQFDRCFRSTFGTTAHQYLLRVRVEAACRRLAQGHETVAAIAMECGFCDHAHFTRCFRAVMQATPKQYRQAHQRGALQQETCQPTAARFGNSQAVSSVGNTPTREDPERR